MNDVSLSASEAPTQRLPQNTKTRSRSEQKRELIIAAAASLFTEQGYVSTSMDKVAEQAGVSKQTVYSHFGSKEGLFVASIEAKCIVNSIAPELFQQTASTETILLELARHFNELLLSEEAVQLTRLCFASAETHPEVSRLFYDTAPANLQFMLSEFLTERTAQGDLDIADPSAAANQFIAMINGDEPFRARLGLEAKLTPEELDDYIQSSVRMFMKGYASE